MGPGKQHNSLLKIKSKASLSSSIVALYFGLAKLAP